VLGIHRWQTIAKVLFATGLILCFLMMSLIFADSSFAARKERGGGSKPITSTTKLSGTVAEASPPPVIQALRQELEKYQPQVMILSPQPQEVLQDNTVTVRFQVKDLPIFKHPQLGLGPHLHLFLDNQPYQAVYDLNQPLILQDLTPGTHILRAFASRPWHESFKNEGAYAETIFHIFTQTQDNSPNPDLPLLTYSRPQGAYGAEPILLDFYLTNAPLHLVAQESSEDDIPDWRVRATVNGNPFILDRWQPIYLKGLKPGKNWVQLEILDEKGNPVQNVFNNTVRIINYEPGGKDTLSQLVQGQLSVEQARGMVDPNYQLPVEPQPESSPAASPSPVVTVTPAPAIAPSPKSSLVSPSISPSPVPTPTEHPLETTAAAKESSKQIPPAKKGTPPEFPFNGIIDRLRRLAPGMAPQEEKVPETTPSVAPTATIAPTPESSPSPAIAPKPSVRSTPKPEPEVIPSPITPTLSPSPIAEETKPTAAGQGWQGVWRSLPWVSPTPESSPPSQEPAKPTQVSKPAIEPTPVVTPEPVAPEPASKPGFMQFLNSSVEKIRDRVQQIVPSPAAPQETSPAAEPVPSPAVPTASPSSQKIAEPTLSSPAPARAVRRIPADRYYEQLRRSESEIAPETLQPGESKPQKSSRSMPSPGTPGVQPSTSEEPAIAKQNVVPSQERDRVQRPTPSPKISVSPSSSVPQPLQTSDPEAIAQ